MIHWKVSVNKCLRTVKNLGSLNCLMDFDRPIVYSDCDCNDLKVGEYEITEIYSSYILHVMTKAKLPPKESDSYHIHLEQYYFTLLHSLHSLKVIPF